MFQSIWVQTWLAGARFAEVYRLPLSVAHLAPPLCWFPHECVAGDRSAWSIAPMFFLCILLSSLALRCLLVRSWFNIVSSALHRCGTCWASVLVSCFALPSTSFGCPFSKPLSFAFSISSFFTATRRPLRFFMIVLVKCRRFFCNSFANMQLV